MVARRHIHDVEMPEKARALRIPFATRAGKLVHVSEVDPGLREDCFCPGCGKPLVARKGAIKVHHFAHDGDHPCNGETILHLLAKQLLRERIESALLAGLPIPIRWKCRRCENEHRGDLLKRAKAVQLETGLEGKVPDLTLIGSSEDACAVIEVVVTHSPEPEARKTYAARKIPIVEVHIDSMADLIALRDATELEPHSVSFCPVPDWQLQTVNLAKLPVRLDQLIIEHKGCELVVLDRELRGVGDHSIKGRFVFDRPELAGMALAGLKSGNIDGLNDPEWMLTQCKNRVLHRELVHAIANGLHEYRLVWQGFGKTSWRRTSGREQFRMRHIRSTYS